jgi:predicted nucleic acid-binding protein
MTIIANTTVLSNFASIGEIDFLHRLYRTLYISTHVYEEIQAGLNEGYRFYKGIEKLVYPLSEKGWIHLIGLDTAEEIRLFAEMPKQLHSGEASCLAIAGVRQWLFLSDDATARRIGIRRGVAVSGTI